MPNIDIPNHPLVGQSLVYGADREPYDPNVDTEGGTLILGNKMRVTVRAVFTDWNDIPGLDMLYVYVPDTGYSTHVSPREGGWRILSNVSETVSLIDYDTESNDYALDDCGWYHVPSYTRPWWAVADCAGPRVGESKYGVLCETHYNAMCICNTSHGTTECPSHPTCQGGHEG